MNGQFPSTQASEYAANVPSVEAFREPYFFFTNDRNRKIVYVSPSVKAVLGYEPESLIGRSYEEFLVGPSPLNEDVPEAQRLRWGGDASSHVGLRAIATADQKLKVVRVQTYGEKNEAGEVVKNYAIAQDISATLLFEQDVHDGLIELKRIRACLSGREVDVLGKIMRGKLNKMIARDLQITERTVENVRSRLINKFQVKTSAELICKATELRMLSKILCSVQPEDEREDFVFLQETQEG